MPQPRLGTYLNNRFGRERVLRARGGHNISRRAPIARQGLSLACAAKGCNECNYARAHNERARTKRSRDWHGMGSVHKSIYPVCVAVLLSFLQTTISCCCLCLCLSLLTPSLGRIGWLPRKSRSENQTPARLSNPQQSSCRPSSLPLGLSLFSLNEPVGAGGWLCLWVLTSQAHWREGWMERERVCFSISLFVFFKREI